MNISYEKNKSLKDIETKFKKYPRTKKNRFTRYLINLFHTSDIRTPLQMQRATKFYFLVPREIKDEPRK